MLHKICGAESYPIIQFAANGNILNVDDMLGDTKFVKVSDRLNEYSRTRKVWLPQENAVRHFWLEDRYYGVVHLVHHVGQEFSVISIQPCDEIQSVPNVKTRMAVYGPEAIKIFNKAKQSYHTCVEIE